jgi:hypothetical protein
MSIHNQRKCGNVIPQAMLQIAARKKMQTEGSKIE